MARLHELQWEVGWSDHENEAPKRWVYAKVPGAVQLDWARAENWDDPYYGDNWQQYGWMEDKYWTYRTHLAAPILSDDDRFLFVSKGIDYRFHIRLNGELLWTQEGMFTPVELDLTEVIGQGGELTITIEPTPKLEGAWRARAEASHSCKPAVSYGWDWHPRLIPLGIWDETYLESRPNVHLVSTETRYDISLLLDKVSLKLDVRLNVSAAGELVWVLKDPEGKTVFRRTYPVLGQDISYSESVIEPRLWWPQDQGEQPLYTSEVYLSKVEGRSVNPLAQSQKIGFRRVKLVMHEGAWAEPSEFPKSRSNPPITLEINGRRIFCKGTNWVNPDIFPGRLTAETYRKLLELAREANMNMLRVWGGGIVNKESFFELCDEMGLMVWQEFPLACNLYPDTPEYLKVLDQESRSIVMRLRKHPSVVLWCGGNELFNSWSGMTDQSLPLRMLNANCYELNPEIPFLMTSPLEGMGHGNYVFRDESGEDVLQAMLKARNTAYTEFGIPSPSSVEQLLCFIPQEDLFPPRPGTAWESHHGFNAWVGNTWLMPDLIEDYFGPSETLEQLVENGQLLQSEGYKCIYEESRRQKPRCAMALNWCYNEPWPTAANNSIVMWPAVRKPAYYAVQASCRPVLTSARIPKFTWQEGEWFEPELWLLNDSQEKISGGRIEVYLTLGNDRYLLLNWQYNELSANQNQRGPTARFLLPNVKVDRMKLEVLVADRPEWGSEYTLLFKCSENPLMPRVQMLNL